MDSESGRGPWIGLAVKLDGVAHLAAGMFLIGLVVASLGAGANTCSEGPIWPVAQVAAQAAFMFDFAVNPPDPNDFAAWDANSHGVRIQALCQANPLYYRFTAGGFFVAGTWLVVVGLGLAYFQPWARLAALAGSLLALAILLPHAWALLTAFRDDSGSLVITTLAWGVVAVAATIGLLATPAAARLCRAEGRRSPQPPYPRGWWVLSLRFLIGVAALAIVPGLLIATVHGPLAAWASGAAWIVRVWR